MNDEVRWDPGQYERYADERGRPYFELLDRVRADAPRTVVDLGCGPGRLTATLLDRWPGASVEGVDSSPEMISAAADRVVPGRLSFVHGSLLDWAPVEPVDVVVSNATLQWVPGHVELLPTLVRHVVPGGWFAFSVPGNFAEPSHRLLYELAAEQPWASVLEGREIGGPSAYGAGTYLAALARLGLSVDAWETTYFHLLSGPDPVFEWIKGTGARPVLQALPDDERPRFEAEYRARLRAAYPEREFGTVLPFRRVFVVARVPAA